MFDDIIADNIVLFKKMLARNMMDVSKDSLLAALGTDPNEEFFKKHTGTSIDSMPLNERVSMVEAAIDREYLLQKAREAIDSRSISTIGYDILNRFIETNELLINSGKDFQRYATMYRGKDDQPSAPCNCPPSSPHNDQPCACPSMFEIKNDSPCNGDCIRPCNCPPSAPRNDQPFIISPCKDESSCEGFIEAVSVNESENDSTKVNVGGLSQWLIDPKDQKENVWKKLRTTSFPDILLWIFTPSETKYNPVHNMLVLLNENIRGKDVIELVDRGYIDYAWLGLYFRYNQGCHADDVIDVLEEKLCHPYFVFNMYEYPLPSDFVKLFKKYHKTTIEKSEGTTVNMGLRELFRIKSIEWITEVLKELSEEISNEELKELIDEGTDVSFYGTHIEKHVQSIGYEDLAVKYADNMAEILWYNNHFKLLHDKVFVKWCGRTTKEFFECIDHDHLCKNISIAIDYLNHYWREFGKHDTTAIFNTMQIHSFDILAVDSTTLLPVVNSICDAIDKL